MIQASFNNIRVDGIATVVPCNKEDILEKYSDKFGETAVKQFIKNVGVKERRVAKEKQTSSDLAYIAAERIIKHKNINKEEIGILIYVTQTPDYRIPATACVLHKRLGLSKNCIAYDINLGCSGYVFGLHTICSLLQSSDTKVALLCVGDTSNKGIAPEDKSAAMLFGDGGSATLLKKETNGPVISTGYMTDGNGFKAIIIPAGAYRNRELSRERTIWSDGNERSDYDLYMNGVDVFSFTISEVPDMIKQFLANSNNNYDNYIFHQANLFIIKQLIKLCRLPKEKVHISMDRYGNTSVTSIPLTICDRYGKDEKDSEVNIFACGFGIGLSWGVCSFNVRPSDVLSIEESDDYYEDGEVSHV